MDAGHSLSAKIKFIHSCEPGPLDVLRLTALKPKRLASVKIFLRSSPMPYALFCNEAKLSKAYPTEADVWKHANDSGLVVDVVSDEGEAPTPRSVLDYDYQIKACQPDPQENPEQNEADAERAQQLEFNLH